MTAATQPKIANQAELEVEPGRDTLQPVSLSFESSTGCKPDPVPPSAVGRLIEGAAVAPSAALLFGAAALEPGAAMFEPVGAVVLLAGVAPASEAAAGAVAPGCGEDAVGKGAVASGAPLAAGGTEPSVVAELGIVLASPMKRDSMRRARENSSQCT